MRFLTPLAALVAIAALAPLTAAWLRRGRVASVRRALGLPQPSRPSGLVRIGAATAALAVLGLAAAQPVLTRSTHERARADAQTLFVVDTSRSMAASTTRTSPTRLDRAVAAAVRLRAAIPAVASGLATLTDRVLPDLLPVAGSSAFDAVAGRGIGIERPPPRDSGVRATSLAALAQVASGNYFEPRATRRIVVLLTDGESNPVDAGGVARALRGYRFLAVRFWRSGEAVYGPDGRPEAGYRPDPAGRAILRELAAATGGHTFDESHTGAAASYLMRLAGHGSTRETRAAGVARTPVAPYVAAVALLLLLASLVPMQGISSRLRSPKR
jgi:hypothetical protein